MSDCRVRISAPTLTSQWALSKLLNLFVSWFPHLKKWDNHSLYLMELWGLQVLIWGKFFERFPVNSRHLKNISYDYYFYYKMIQWTVSSWKCSRCSPWCIFAIFPLFQSHIKKKCHCTSPYMKVNSRCSYINRKSKQRSIYNRTFSWSRVRKRLLKKPQKVWTIRKQIDSFKEFVFIKI